MKTKFVIFIVLLFAIGLAGFLYAEYTKPYHLPKVEHNLSKTQLGFNFHDEQITAQRFQSGSNHDLSLSQLKEDIDNGKPPKVIQDLKIEVKKHPQNMFFSNKLRLWMRKQNQLDSYVEFMNQLNASNQKVGLQVALAYVDKLQQPNLGTASLGQLSVLSIRELNKVLKFNPNNWLAHYARGLNNLYWPVGLKRVDKSIQDLSYCVAVAKEYRAVKNPLWPKAFVAYGDALVKSGDIENGYKVWKDGFNQFPNDAELKKRVQSGKKKAYSIVKSVRGIDSFKRPKKTLTDISVLWKSK